MTVGFPKRVALLEPELWARMEASWEREFGSEAGKAGATETGSGNPWTDPITPQEFLEYVAEKHEEELAADEEVRAKLAEASERAKAGRATLEAFEQSPEGRRIAEMRRGRENRSPNLISVGADEPAILRGKVPEITVSLLEIQDPGHPANDTEPDDGMRWVGVRLRIENTGDHDYDETPSSTARLVDSEGDEYEGLVGWIEPDLDDFITLAPGEVAEGFLTFEVPERATVAAFQFTFDAGKTPSDAAEWNV
jgi:Domain of unknown function (DUF4352)